MKFKLRHILIGTGIAVLGLAAAGAAVGISEKKSDKPDTSDTMTENLDLINLIGDLQSQINSVNNENEQIKNQLNSVNTENQKLNNKANQLTASLNELKSENASLKDIVDAIEPQTHLFKWNFTFYNREDFNGTSQSSPLGTVSIFSNNIYGYTDETNVNSYLNQYSEPQLLVQCECYDRTNEADILCNTNFIENMSFYYPGESIKNSYAGKINYDWPNSEYPNGYSFTIAGISNDGSTSDFIFTWKNDDLNVVGNSYIIYSDAAESSNVNLGRVLLSIERVI